MSVSVQANNQDAAAAEEQVSVFTTVAQWVVLPLFLLGTVGSLVIVSMFFSWTTIIYSMMGSFSFFLFILFAIVQGWLPPFFAWQPNPAKAPKNLTTTRFSTAVIPQDLDWIVVGSGIGGLTCAAILSQCGYKVGVVEAHEIAGGSTHEYHVDGKTRYTFPSGLHYVIPHCQQVLQMSAGCRKPMVHFRKLGNSEGFYERIRLTRLQQKKGSKSDLLIKDESQLRKELHDRYPDLKEPLQRYESLATSVLTISPLWMALHILNWRIRKPLMQLLLPKVWWQYAGRTAQDVFQEVFGSVPEQLREQVNEITSWLCALWVDTGCPPQRASFFMSVAVALGFPHEGGVYPDGGPQSIAQCLIQCILHHGGAVWVRAPVAEIIVDNNRAVGVQVVTKNGASTTKVSAKCGVISACGWRNTARLVSRPCDFYPLEKLRVPQGDGFVMANIGIHNKDQQEALECQNLWPQPGGNGQSIFDGISKYLQDPLKVPPTEIPLMITFPSVKDRAYDECAEYQTAQILALAKTEWFGPIEADEGVKDRLPTWKQPERSQDYETLKEQWRARLEEAFLSYYPQLKGKIELFDVSTPLTIEHYLPTGSGSAIGLDVNANDSACRFTSMETMELLDMKTPVKGLWMTGQDTLLVGVPLAQAAGLMTALRIAGPLQSIHFLIKSCWLLLYSYGQGEDADEENKDNKKTL